MFVLSILFFHTCDYVAFYVELDMNNRIGWARRSFLSESKTKWLKFQMNLLTESALLIMVLLQVFQNIPNTKYCSSVPAQNVTKKALNNVSADNQSFCRAVRWPTGGTLTKAGRLIKCAEPWAPRARPQCPNVKRQIHNISSLVQHPFQTVSYWMWSRAGRQERMFSKSLTRSKICNPGKSPDNTQLPRYKSLLFKLSLPHHSLQL